MSSSVNNDFDSLLLHCLSVLALDKKTNNFLEPGRYTQHLAALLSISRFALIYHCFGSQNDPVNVDCQVKLFHAIHRHAYVDGCTGPLASVIRWLRYGQNINRNTQKEPDMVWMDDTTLCFKGINYPVSHLSEVCLKGLQRTQELMIDHLLLGFNALNLDYDGLVDEKDNTSVGFNFTELELNRRLHVASPRQLLQCALSPSSDSWNNTDSPGTLDKAMCRRYLGSFETLQDHLLVLIYMTAGQPPRRKELLSCTWMNQIAGTRSLYIHKGNLAVVTSYHKGQTRSGLSKHIPRFLPTQLRNMMMAYLYYIRPFAVLCEETLEKQSVYRSPLLWPARSGGMNVQDGSKLTVAMGRVSWVQHNGIAMNPQIYRQISIKFSIDVVRIDFGILGHEDDQSGSEYDSEQPTNIHTRQAAHTALTEKNNYGVSKNRQPSVESSLWDQFATASSMWHTFLSLDVNMEQWVGSSTAIVCVQELIIYTYQTYGNKALGKRPAVHTTAVDPAYKRVKLSTPGII